MNYYYWSWEKVCYGSNFNILKIIHACMNEYERTNKQTNECLNE